MRAVFLWAFAFCLIGFSTSAYSGVRCGKLERANRSWGEVGYELTCQGREIIVTKDTPIEAITVQVLDGDSNKVKGEWTFDNPPGNVEYYGLTDLDDNSWFEQEIEKNGYTFARKDKIQIKPDEGIMLSGNTQVYADEWVQQQIGTLDDVMAGGSKDTVIAQCMYINYPEVVRSDRCPNETLCIAPLRCESVGIGESKVTVICRATNNGTKCPPPTQCALDNSTHIRQLGYAENEAELLEYDLDSDGTGPNQPAEIELPGPLEPAGAVQ